MRDISVMFYNHVIVLCITVIHSFELHFCVFNFQTKRLACVRKPLKSSKQEKYKVHRLPDLLQFLMKQKNTNISQRLSFK